MAEEFLQAGPRLSRRPAPPPLQSIPSSKRQSGVRSIEGNVPLYLFVVASDFTLFGPMP
jgi:hypothetical protein